MRTIAATLAFILVAVGGLSGCQTVETHPRTAIGAGAGAAGGALLGGLISRSATGVVVGGLLGGLAGGAIGYYLDRQDKTGEEAAQEVGYKPEQGTVVRVDGVRADPASLKAGETVNLAATYTILTPKPNEPARVRETREVRLNGRLVANPTTEFSRTDGRFTSALPITLPRDASVGQYEVTTTVEVGDRASRAISSFTVQ